ncbi:LytS/YhcK type 5TM receptor domain-containing protein [Gymnodinialimonas hymeniacidonis]|uniref:LytS/YhcK type 5TM receptor domain-containing protein n=1 Tax=Gymnodinialimonas hymeniacidonis TaxID=3126508 RepID=UPI0034C660AF
MNFPILMDMAAALAVTALIAESYGAVRRRVTGNYTAPIVLGVLFGAMSALQMHTPIEPFDGLIIDLRNIPVALAGAFLGWRGLIPCLLITMAVRIEIGGVGMVSGLWAMVITGLAGMIWCRKLAGLPKRNFGMLLLLALAMSAHLLGAVALPRDLAVWFYTSAAGPILVMNLIAVPLIGALLERENRRILAEEEHASMRSKYPNTGLLSGHSLVREVTNAFAAHPLGSLSGILLIEPDRSVWRSLFSRSEKSELPEVEARIFSDTLTHWSLAGRSADGRIIVPITRQELEVVHRLRPLIRDLLSDHALDGKTSLFWEVSSLEADDPADFLRRVECAALTTHPDWISRTKAMRYSSLKPNGASRVRRSKIFNPDEHEALFAKANFLIERGRS